MGSKENLSHVPGGGDKKIATKAVVDVSKVKSKVGSKENLSHVPGGGDKKIAKEGAAK